MSRRCSDYARHHDDCSSGDEEPMRSPPKSKQHHHDRYDRHQGNDRPSRRSEEVRRYENGRYADEGRRVKNQGDDRGVRRSDEDHRREKEQRYEDERYEDDRYEDECRRSEDRRNGGDRRSDDRFKPEERRHDDRHFDHERRYHDDRHLDDERRDRRRSDDGRRRDSQFDDERRRYDNSPRRSLTPPRRSLTPTNSRQEQLAPGSRNSRLSDERSRDGSDGTDERSAGGTWKSIKHADDLKHLDGGRDVRESDEESEKTEFQSENGTWRPITPEIAARIRQAMAEEEARQKEEEARQKAEAASRRRSRDLSDSEDAPKPRRSDASRASRGSSMRDKTPPRGNYSYTSDRSPAGSSAGRSPTKSSTHSPRSKIFSVDFDMAVDADDVASLIWKFDPVGAVIRRLPEKVSKAKGIKVGDLLVSINNRKVDGKDRAEIEDIWMQEQDRSSDFRMTFEHR